MKHSFVLSCLALLTLCGLVLPAQAQLSVTGSITGDGTLTMISSTEYTLAFNVDGNDAILGSFTGQSLMDLTFVDPTHVSIDGTFKEVFSDGSSLSGDITGDADITSLFHGTTESEYDITGGSGRFLGVTGMFVNTGTFVRTGTTSVTGSGTYVGTLSVPEPGSVALLLVTGFSGAGLLLKKRCGRK